MVRRVTWPPRLLTLAICLRAAQTHFLHGAGRRSSKLVSLVTSCFSASYVRWWAEYFPAKPLLCTPTFDGRAVCYPTDAVLRDYLAWRQADAHINNQASLHLRRMVLLKQPLCC